MSQAGRNLLKCRYCEWQTTLWVRRRPTGWGRLQAHVKGYHQQEQVELWDREDEFYGNIVDEYQDDWERGVR
jgi:hypothetical protein